MIRMLRSFISLIGMSRISILGATIVTSAFIADLFLILGELFLFESHPYIGVATYMLFPGLMTMGLLLIPIGIWWRLRQLGKSFSLATIRSILDMALIDKPGHVVQIVSILSLVNLVIFSIVGYRGYHFTESREFCGQLCHQVMEPELIAYSRSPHSEISCVECHIGPGAGWFVKSKLSGVRQVLAVLRESYSRPIETPIHNLRPARDVCEICHRPEIFHGDRIKTVEHFDPDAQNTRSYTVLNLRIGGGGGGGVQPRGIHWHVNPDNQVRYYSTDKKREKVAWIELTRPDGSRKVWTRPDIEVDETDLEPEQVRMMDCIDCHNRPTHVFLSPEEVLDRQLAEGLLDPAIPWIRKLAEEVLVPIYATSEEAMAGIAGLPQLYQKRHPEVWAAHQQGIEKSVPVLQEVHRQFVFPQMNVQWNTYTTMIGHPIPQTARCFRCHNGIFKTEKDEGITIDCNSCHYVLANREENPEILKTLRKE